MAEYQGVITGIGSADDSINLITPEIDAKLYNYIIGKDTIIIGLVASKSGITGELTAGMCVYNGYRGILSTSISGLDLEDIYAKFTINNNTNTPDAFSIVTSSTALTSSGNDYYIKLYTYDNGDYVVNSSFDTAHSYPVNAYNADNATNLVANGTIAASATGTTQSVNDNSNKIATTEYAHNQIAAELDEATATFNVMQENVSIATITLKRRAKYVLAKIHYLGNGYYQTSQSNNNYPSITLPNGFYPKETMDIRLSAFWRADVDAESIDYVHQILKCQFAAYASTPTITRVDTWYGSSEQNISTEWQDTQFGYECM